MATKQDCKTCKKMHEPDETMEDLDNAADEDNDDSFVDKAVESALTEHIDEDDYSPPVAGSESPKYEGKGKGRGKKST